MEDDHDVDLLVACDSEHPVNESTHLIRERHVHRVVKEDDARWSRIDHKHDFIFEVFVCVPLAVHEQRSLSSQPQLRSRGTFHA